MYYGETGGFYQQKPARDQESLTDVCMMKILHVFIWRLLLEYYILRYIHHTDVINILLGFENLPGLSTKDFVTLAIIQRYIDFKVSIVQVNITTVPTFPKIASISQDTTNK